jgi:predicted AlkP superfamily pyrophosphatase or phosphodiesterase
MLETVEGVDRVLDADGQREMHINHPRSGELVAIAKPGAWFTYYYWLDDAKAPDFARTVDIHRKPGYDPVELFLDPKLPAAKLTIAGKLLKKKLGFRYLMDVIPLDATLVKGSHGRAADQPSQGAMFITPRTDLVQNNRIEPTQVCDLILRHLEF